MIVSFFLDVALGLAGWVLDMFPADFEVPEWLTGFAVLVNEIFGNAVGMGAWVPWPFVLLVIGSVLTMWAIGFGIKFARWLIGLVPTMGGG